jgi:hypothetical protein
MLVFRFATSEGWQQHLLQKRQYLPYKSTQRYVSEGQHRHLHYENHKSQQYGSKNRELLD